MGIKSSILQEQTQHSAWGTATLDQSDGSQPEEQERLPFFKRANARLSAASHLRMSCHTQDVHRVDRFAKTCNCWNTKSLGFSQISRQHDPTPFSRSSIQDWKLFQILTWRVVQSMARKGHRPRLIPRLSLR